MLECSFNCWRLNVGIEISVTSSHYHLTLSLFIYRISGLIPRRLGRGGRMASNVPPKSERLSPPLEKGACLRLSQVHEAPRAGVDTQEMPGISFLLSSDANVANAWSLAAFNQ